MPVSAPPLAIQLPRLRRDQYDIAAHPAKVKTLAMGRRWGKSVLGQCLAIPTAAAGGRVAWVVPTYKNGRPLWRIIEQVLGPLRKAGLVRINRSERTVEFPNGGYLALYSMDNPDSIRGESFHLVIVDEAAMVREEAWTDCIQPTLADYDGDAILISTPKRRNWFFREYQRGLAEMAQALREGREATQASWSAPSSANPNPNIQKAARLAQDRVSSDTYQQEWLAQFLEDGGAVFRGVKAVATASTREPYYSSFVMGVDWGKSNDYTVLTVMDAATNTVVEIDRFNDIGWRLQRGRLMNLAQKWRPWLILAESNSIGGVNIEALQDEGLPVAGFETTASSKGPLIENLVLGIEREELKTLNDDVLIGELEAYESERNHKTGRITYSAPPGLHDDCVISQALAYWAIVHAAEYLPEMPPVAATEHEHISNF